MGCVGEEVVWRQATRTRVDCQASRWREVPRGARLGSAAQSVCIVCDLEKGMKAMAGEERAGIHVYSGGL